MADLILKLLTKETNINNFKISSNNDDFGQFDDVVLETDKGEIYAIQLKHFNNKTCLQKNLLEKGKDFALTKYYESLSKIKNPCKLILFTNMNYNFDSTQSQINFNSDALIKMWNCSPIQLLNNSKNGTCYNFEILTCPPAKFESYKNFFDNFSLYCGQASVEKLKASIILRFQKQFSCNESVCHQFLQFISSWSLREGEKEMLDKILMQRVVALLLLDPYIEAFDFGHNNENTKILQDTISLFKITVISKECCKKVKQIWSNFDNELEDKQKIKELKKKFQLKFSFEKELKHINKTKLLWLMNKCPLVVLAENDTVNKVLKLCPTEHFIVLTNDENFIKLEYAKIFQNLSDLDLTSEIYQKIIKNFFCSIQGKEKLSLEDLIDINKDFLKIITVSDLVKMLDGPYHIGEKKEIIAANYISRFLTKNLISINYLKKINKNILVVFDYIKKTDKIKGFLGNFNLISIPTYLKDTCIQKDLNTVLLFHSSPIIKKYVTGPDIYISEDECTSENFEKICKKNKNKEKYHHFRLIDDTTVEWIRSKNDISDLEEHRINQKSVEETTIYRLKPANNINLVIGDPGMGKSELLKNIKNNSKPDFFCILFSPKDTTLLCTHLENKNDLHKIFVSFILNIKFQDCSIFDKEVINLLIKNNHVMYFWDALDEISSNSLEITINLIQEISKKCYCQWISSRSHLKKQLEKKFNILSRSINQFDEKEQSLYIHKRLENLYSEKDIKEVVKKIRSSVTLMKHNDILGIPLQVFMLTELFLQDQEKYFNLLKDMFSLTDLYHYIIEEKFNVYYKDKAGVDSPNHALEQIFKVPKKSMFENYEKAALKASVSKELLKRFNINCENFLKDLELQDDNIGLIKEVTDSFPHFLHNSYAEYFVATYFSEHYKEIPDLKNILFDKRYANIRFFFDLLNARDEPSLVAVLCKNLDLIKKYQSELKHGEDKTGKNALQLACSWGQRYPTLKVENLYGTYILDNTDDDTVNVDTTEYTEMLQYLLEHCNLEETSCKFLNGSSLSYAEDSNCLIAKVKLLLKQNNQFSKLKNNNEDISILYYCTKFGYTEVIDLFENLPFVKTKINDFSLLHVAVEYKQEKYLQKLLEIPVYKYTIDEEDKYGRTPLFISCQLGFYKIAKILIKSGANVNHPTKESCTPLHVSCLHAYDNIVKLLLKFGANINAFRNYNITPLHTACWNGHNTTVKLLTENQVDVNIQALDGCTPLYVASRNKHDKVVDLMITAGADINLPQKENVTPLLIASQEGHEKNVELLIKAQVNVLSNTGESALYVACQNGHDKIVKMLIKTGANVETIAHNGWNSLFIACQQGHLRVVKLLIKASVNVEVRDRNGLTPLMVAFNNGHAAIVDFLKKLKPN